MSAGLGKISIHGKFLQPSLVAECLADVWHVDLCHVVARHSGVVVVRAEPALLDRMFESTLDDRVFGEFAHIDCAELIDLGGDCVFFDERFFCEGELQGIVGGQGDVQTTTEVD